MTPSARYVAMFRPHVPIIVLALVLSGVGTSIQAISVNLFADLATIVGTSSDDRRFPITVHLLKLSPVFSGIPIVLPDRSRALSTLGTVMLTIVGLVFIRGFVTFGRTYLLHRVTYSIMTRMRNSIYAKILSLPMSVIARQRSGDLLSRTVGDVDMMTTSVHAVSNLLQSGLAVTIFLSYMLLRSWILTVAMALFLPVVMLVLYTLGVRIRRSSLRMQQELGVVASRVQEGIAGLKVLKSFGAENEEQSRLMRETRAMYRTAMRRSRAHSLQTPLSEFTIAVAMMGVFGAGCWLIFRGVLTFSDVLAHMGMAALLLQPMRTIGQFYTMLQQGLASSERIEEILSLPSEDMDTGARIDTVRGEIEFRDVTFDYGAGDGPALDHVSFKIESGQTVALVGRSGAGKTTLIHLIPRFYVPTEGSILLDGVPISDLALTSLRSHVAMVPQETLLFAGPISDNIRLAKPNASDSEVEEAARRAFAHEFIASLPEGYETALGERGIRLSGGQQQRIAIARAFLKDPKVFLLDEATAALDSESEAMIQKSFVELRRDRTAFVIAHRLSTVLDADLILVLDGGRLIESGRHEDLLARGGAYARLYRTQFAHLDV